MTTPTSPPAPPSPPASAAELPPRLRRAIEVVYAIEGVVAVRIWQWPGTVALGVLTAPPGSEDVLRRIDLVTTALREPGETWELGLLDGDPSSAT
jgi:hypothetical protein